MSTAFRPLYLLRKRLLGLGDVPKEMRELMRSELARASAAMEVAQNQTANAATWALISDEAWHQSAAGRRAHSLMEALAPMDVRDGRYVRVGRDYDGGYVMLDDFGGLSAAYSFGISDDVSWDQAMADRGLTVHLYDHTVPALPSANPRFHFHRRGLCGFKRQPSLQTLAESLAENGDADRNDLVLKMDVEGCEWDILAETASSVLNRFRQVVVEYHAVASALWHQRACEERLAALRKLNATHQIVHLHANTYGSFFRRGHMVVPDSLEVTYVRRADFGGRLVPSERLFPTDLDQPNAAEHTEIFLGRFDAQAR